MTPSVSVFGPGNVGTVGEACLAHKSHNVDGVDLSAIKVAAMKARRSPIGEPRVSDLIADAHQAGRWAVSDSEAAILHSDISFFCVGTPSLWNGRLELGHIQPACEDIGRVLKTKNSLHLVSLGNLIGSNRAYIDEVISRIGSLLSNSLTEVVAGAEVVIIVTRGLNGSDLRASLRSGQVVLDRVNLEPGSRPDVSSDQYAGICC